MSDDVHQQPWVSLSLADQRQMLIALIGHEFGTQPEQHLEAIQNSRRGYAKRFLQQARVRSSDVLLELGSGCLEGGGGVVVDRPSRTMFSLSTARVTEVIRNSFLACCNGTVRLVFGRCPATVDSSLSIAAARGCFLSKSEAEGLKHD